MLLGVIWRRRSLADTVEEILFVVGGELVVVLSSEIFEDGPKLFGGRYRVAIAGRPQEDHEVHSFDALL